MTTNETTTQITLAEVMQTYLLTDAGELLAVEHMTDDEFCSAIDILLQRLTTQQRKWRRRDLYALDFTKMTDRWFAIDFLLQHGATLPVKVQAQ